MKTISLPLFFFLFTRLLFSQSNMQQSLSINSTGAAPAPSAMLDVNANNKGILVPRMTTSDRTSIASPATSLLVYDTDAGEFFFFNGTVWVSMATAKVLADADADTKIQVEESPDEDIVRIDIAGTERLRIKKNPGSTTQVEFPNNGDNTFLGTSAGNSNTSGDNNTAVGKSVMVGNTTGNNNSALGAFALTSNTTGSNNTAVGEFALSGNLAASDNTVLGYMAMSGSNTGIQNTAIGSSTMTVNTSGTENTAVGYMALAANTTGPQNTAVGNLAMAANTVGDDNAAFGYNALAGNISGHDNSAVGRAALFANTSGSDNVAFGRSTLGTNTTGSGNTAIGRFGMGNNVTGNNNTTLGFQTEVSTSNLTNATAIGAFAQVSASNSLVLGSINGVNGATSSVNVGIGVSNPELRLHILGGSDATTTGGGYIQTGSSTGSNIAIDENEIMARNNGAISSLLLNFSGGDVRLGNASSMVGVGRTAATNNLEVEGTASKTTAGSWLANSDARLKKNITSLNSQEMLQKLLALQGITYEWNDNKTGSKRPEGIHYGFTAQNIQAVFPTLVEEDNLGYLQTAYGTYDAMIVEAIRALTQQIAAQQAEIERLKKLETQYEKITAALQGAGIAVEK